MSLADYQNNLDLEVLSATPLQLVQMLYQGAFQSVNGAVKCLECGDIRGRSRQINKACAILEELIISLDREQGGEVAKNLAELYSYMHQRLVEANVQQAKAPLQEVAKHLNTLLQAWQQISSSPHDGIEASADLSALAVSVGGTEVIAEEYASYGSVLHISA